MPTFPIAPAESRYLWFILPVCLLLLAVIALLFLSVRGSRHATFEIGTDGLRLRGDLYSRTIPYSQLQVEDARRVDLKKEYQLAPGWKTMGTALPGYNSGWFRLNNGEKALVFVTDKTKAVYIPTSNNYSILVSPAHPDEFLATLKAVR